MRYNITPVTKPRQTRSDKWNKRPCVMKYRAFADEVRASGMSVCEYGDHVRFFIPMPKSWSKKKKTEMVLTPHKQTPDIDNLLKALLDALFDDDSHIYDISASKMWDREGAIAVTR